MEIKLDSYYDYLSAYILGVREKWLKDKLTELNDEYTKICLDCLLDLEEDISDDF
jgi:hypothetical protein